MGLAHGKPIYKEIILQAFESKVGRVLYDNMVTSPIVTVDYDHRKFSKLFGGLPRKSESR